MAVLVLTQKTHLLAARRNGGDDTLKSQHCDRRWRTQVRDGRVRTRYRSDGWHQSVRVGLNVLAKAKSKGTLKQLAAAIAAKRQSISPEDARELAAIERH